MTQARALWIVEKDLAELRDEILPPPGTGELVIRTLFSGISRGTESIVASGGVPRDQWENMRAPFQIGSFGFPVKYSYAAVGRVEAGPPELLGRTVFSLHPHQDVFTVPEQSAIPLPENVPAERAVLAANMETALNVVWDAGVLPGDRVAIVGCGVVGALVAYLATRIPGTNVTMIDTSTQRRALAKTFGCAFALPDDAPQNCDRVIHTSATSAGLATSIACAGPEATVVEASWYGSAMTEIALGGAFHSKRLKLVSSQVGRVPADRAPRWTMRRRLETALALLTDDRLDILISGETDFAQAEGSYIPALRNPDTLCHRFRYQNG